MLLLAVLSIPLLACISAYEAVRWAECGLDCDERHVVMKAILDSTMCSGLATIGHIAIHADGKCEEARRALRFTPMACTIREFWRQSEPYRLYHMLAQSPLTLFATLLLLLYATYKWQQQQQEPTDVQRDIYLKYSRNKAQN
jgi:hypothetical protein